jgi:3-deoxy-D-manno-octulosonic-acid transferase
LGNSKFDQAAEGLSADRGRWQDELGLDHARLTLVIGSTRGAEEEDFVLDALEKVGLDKLQVIHAPRHLETAPALAANVSRRFGAAAFRSKGESGPYLILDSYGELSQVYSVADIVIVGGGFSNLGGQNLIQPLAHGKPVIHGPHMQNFRDVVEAAQKVHATIECRTSDELAGAIAKLVASPELRQDMADRAHELVVGSLGASTRYAEAIVEAAKAFKG